MTILDIRNQSVGEIDTILFSERSVNGCEVCYKVERSGCATEEVMRIKDEYDSVYLVSKSDTLNLIEALNKAIELGWVK